MRKTENPTHTLVCTDIANRMVETKAHGKRELHYLIDRLLRDNFIHFTIVKIKGEGRKAKGQLKLEFR
jgi:hypothetical protein